MALNLEALKDYQDKLKSGSGGDYFGLSKEMEGKEVVIRLLPPPDSMKGFYFVEEQGCWLARERLVSYRSFGEQCPMMDIVDEIKKSRDEDLLKLFHSREFSVKTQYYMPVIVLQCEYDSKDKFKNYKVLDDEAKIYGCTKSMISAINRIVTMRDFDHGENGIMDRKTGHNITIMRTVIGQNTQYTAQPWITPLEIAEEKYYDNVVDVKEHLLSKRLPKGELEAKIREYFYGDPPKDSKKSKKKDKKKKKSILDDIK